MKIINSIQEKFILIHIILVLLVFLGTRAIDVSHQTTDSIMVGGMFIGGYFSVFIWAFKSALKKNSMGLVLFTLSFKFLILVGFVMYCMSNKSFNLIGLIIGLSTVIPSIVIWSLLNKKGVNIGTF
ncbi:hypothetical protein N9W41_00410 [bacterium]|nr:hypothetical protein [bacterium]